MSRSVLPSPATAIDMYLADIAQSLRDLVDLATPPPPPEAPADAPVEEVVELREAPKPPVKKRKLTRDEMQAQDGQGEGEGA